VVNPLRIANSPDWRCGKKFYARSLKNIEGASMPRLKINAAVLAILLFTSCAMPRLHPGAVSKLDSQVYDTLLIAQAVIDQARIELTAGTLPEALKPALMRLIDSYNVARTSWLTYRNAVKAGQTADAAGMNRTIAILSAALDSFQSSRSIP